MPDNLSIIQNGYMLPGEILDARAMRPYVNQRGQKVISNAQKQEIVVQNALLRRYEWEKIDAAVIDVMRQPLVGIQDLIARGLTNPLGGLGVSVSTYEQLSDMSDASVNMTVTPRKGENDRVAFTPVSIPVPIISKPFVLDLRTLEASRRGGQGLDVTQTRVATIKVRQALEAMLFNGSTKQMDTFKIYGYTNHPNIDTTTAALYGGGDFGTDGNGHKTIVGMITALAAKGYTGPFGCYVSPTQYSQLLALTGANKSETQLSVILRTIPELLFVRRSNSLDDGVTVVVQLTAEVVDLSIGMDIMPVSWQEFGGMVNEFMVMTAAVPRVKYDANGYCGVAKATSC